MTKASGASRCLTGLASLWGQRAPWCQGASSQRVWWCSVNIAAQLPQERWWKCPWAGNAQQHSVHLPNFVPGSSVNGSERCSIHPGDAFQLQRKSYFVRRNISPKRNVLSATYIGQFRFPNSIIKLNWKGRLFDISNVSFETGPETRDLSPQFSLDTPRKHKQQHQSLPLFRA